MNRNIILKEIPSSTAIACFTNKVTWFHTSCTYIYIYVRYIVDIDMDKLCIGDFSICRSAPEMLKVTPVETRQPSRWATSRHIYSTTDRWSPGLSVLSPWQTRAEQPSVRPSVRPTPPAPGARTGSKKNPTKLFGELLRQRFGGRKSRMREGTKPAL